MATSTVPPRTLNPQDVAAYQRDGFLIIPGLFAADRVLEWKRLMKELIEKDGQCPSGVRVWGAPMINPVLKEAMCDPSVVQSLQQLVGPDLEFLSAKAVFKNTSTKFHSPWHQDWFYWKGATKVSIWIALDDATPANGCLMFIPGTHKKAYTHQYVADKDNAFEMRIMDEEVKDLPYSTIEVKRGDAVVFEDLAIHSSYPNTSGADRWSIISTYRNAAIKDGCGLDESLWSRPLLMSGASLNGGQVY